MIRKVNGFNSRCLRNITGRSYRDEAVTPTYDLVRSVRQRRMRWLGHILRMPALYPARLLLMDCHLSLDELVILAKVRAGWEARVRNL